MLFKNDETYTVAEVQAKLGHASRTQCEAELERYQVVGVRIARCLVFHGAALNAMILRESASRDERGDQPRRQQKRSRNGKFAASYCPHCETKLSRGECPNCGRAQVSCE